MRSVNAAFRVVVIAAVFTVSAVGQQPLPTAAVDPSLSIDLPVEPVRLVTPMTLSDAAQRNDFPAFAAIYANAETREAVSFAELHDFWKWSLTDPLGGFYGADVHERLAARYPGYEAFIADYRIVDSNRNSFYPSAETRGFLLKQAMAGVTAKLATVRQPKTIPQPVSISVRPVSRRVAASVKEPVSQPAQQRAITAVPAPLPIPRRVAGEDTVTPLRTPAPTQVGDVRAARGFALLIAGLIGFGMLTLMLRTPAEELQKETEEDIDLLLPMRIIKLERPAPREDSGSHSSVA